MKVYLIKASFVNYFLSRPVLKIFLISLVNLLSISFCSHAQNPENIKFDLSMVPFSRYGSYMSLSTRTSPTAFHTQPNNPNPQLRLYEVTGRNMFDNNSLFKITPIADTSKMNASYEANPLFIKGTTAKGTFIIYFENDDVVHITGNVPVKLSEIRSIIVPVPGYPQSWKWLDSRIAVTVKTGKGRILMNGKKRKIFIAEPENGKLDLVIEQYHSDWLPKKYTENYETSMTKLKQELKDWEDKMPAVPKTYQHAANLASYINWESVVKPSGYLKRYGMLMSKNWMHSIWSWDNTFNAVALGYTQPALAWDQVMVVLDQQDKNGALPDLVNAENIYWSYRKPPIYGWAINRLMKEFTLSDEQLTEAYAKIAAFTEYWLTYRDANNNGLSEYYFGNDSGWDNATAFDCGFPVESPDLAALLIEQMDVLATISEKLGRSEEAAKWKQHSDEMLKKMIAAFWNGNKFIAKNAITGKYTEASQSLISYIPLILGDKLPRDIRDKMITDLKKPGFLLTKYGLATESPKSTLYEPDGYWRGPVWAPTTLLIVDALKRVHEDDLAKKIAVSFCNTCAKSGFAENFNALTGAPLRDPAYTWTSSVFLILAHELNKN